MITNVNLNVQLHRVLLLLIQLRWHALRSHRPGDQLSVAAAADSLALKASTVVA